MRALRVILLLLMTFGATAAVPARAASPPAPKPGPSALWRTTFVIADIDAALRVWRDILGFRLAYAGGAALRDARVSTLFGLRPDEGARLFVLVSGNIAHGNIGFLVPDGGAERGPAGRAPAGAPALFVKTTAMDEAVPRLVAAGCTLLAAPEPQRAPGRNRMAWFVDPNGIRFVLTERETIELVYPEAP